MMLLPHRWRWNHFLSILVLTLSNVGSLLADVYLHEAKTDLSLWAEIAFLVAAGLWGAAAGWIGATLWYRYPRSFRS